MKIVIFCLVALAGLCVTENENGGRGQTIDPAPKKFGYTSLDIGGGVKLPSDGKKSDLFVETGGMIPGGAGKKVG